MDSVEQYGHSFHLQQIITEGARGCPLSWNPDFMGGHTRAGQQSDSSGREAQGAATQPRHPGSN